MSGVRALVLSMFVILKQQRNLCQYGAADKLNGPVSQCRHVFEPFAAVEVKRMVSGQRREVENTTSATQ
uniref:Secreted protein n=1 Tax=Peronospora matthiolae TaxID=2874970 RepID=A0AAV1UR54_9STRA